METPKSYRIKEQTYRIQPLVWRQGQWLQEHVFQGYDLLAMDEVEITTLMQRKAPLLLAISLVAEGQTPEEKARAGWEAVATLAEDLACSLTPAQLKEMSRDFFTVNPFENLWQLVDYPALAARQKRLSTGSEAASASSPAVDSQPAAAS